MDRVRSQHLRTDVVNSLINRGFKGALNWNERAEGVDKGQYTRRGIVVFGSVSLSKIREHDEARKGLKFLHMPIVDKRLSLLRGQEGLY